MPVINFHNVDCMQFMQSVPDKHYDLAIVDPPYGIGASEMTGGSGKNKQWQKGKKWDSETPTQAYFDELFRISKHQIIWGGNYFILPVSKCWIFWDKGINGDCSFADGELAWCSFDKVLRIAKIRYKGFLGADANRIHPTQKPVALYKWLLTHYAKAGDKILDTHGGSGSIAIACHDLNFDLDICELDKEYFDAMQKRFNNHISQLKLF